MYAEYCLYFTLIFNCIFFLNQLNCLVIVDGKWIIIISKRGETSASVVVHDASAPLDTGLGEVVTQSGATALLSVFQNCHHVLLQINSFHSSDMLVGQTPSLFHTRTTSNLNWPWDLEFENKLSN